MKEISKMKKAIILGATSGIGKELARVLTANNYKVGITGRRVELLEELKSEDPNLFIAKAFDISDETVTVEILDELAMELGEIDLIVICSSIFERNNELSIPIDKKTIDINVSGFTYVANWAFKYFENQKRGHLLGITSISGLRGSAKAPAYSASKAYQIAYLQAFRQKVFKMKLPIIITDIRPGIIDTEMNNGYDFFWKSSVKKTAYQIFKAIHKKRKMTYVTKLWIIPGSFFRAIPDFIYNRMNF
jgi:short-subunit dehydrogenase